MAKQGRREPVCTTCNRTFKRMEHCRRHERAHNRERPYVCQFCSQSFGRKDLVVRHEKNLHLELWTTLRRRDQDAHEGINHRTSLPSPRAVRNRRKSDPLTRTPPISDPSVERAVGDSNTSESPVILTSLISRFPPTVGGNIENERENGFDPNDGNVNYRMISPSHGAMEVTEAVGVGSSLAPISVSNPLSRPVPGTSHMERLEVALPDTSADRLVSFNPTSRNDHFAGEPPFSLTANAHCGFDHMDSISDEGSFMEYLPDFEVALNLQEVSSSPRDGRYGSPSHDARNNLHNVTSLNSGERTASLSKVLFKLPRLITDVQPKLRPIHLDQRKRADLVADFSRRMDCRCDYEGQIPELQSLHRYLTQFFISFNTHLPIFHIPTFDISLLPSPLVIAMCSIGAMYQLEQKRASHLRQLASHALNESDSRRRPNELGTARPVWMVQSKLLILYGALLGGDAATASSALEEAGYLQKEYTLRRAPLSFECEEREVFSLSWSEWIERESSKRLLFGIFIFSSLLTITYNISPGISIGCDLDIELPEEERLWSAPTAEAWKDAIASTTAVKRLSTSRALTQFMFSKQLDPTTETRLGLYAALVLVHGVNIHMWHISQSSNSFTNFCTDPEFEEHVTRRCILQAEAALHRCYQVFARDCRIEAGPPSDSSESPLPFNSVHLLRNCYVRVFSGGGSFNRAVLLSDNDAEIALAVKNYVKKSEFNAPLLTKIVAFMVAGIRGSSQAGRLVIRKTAALTWGLEMAISLWDCALYITKWVHTVLMRQYRPALTSTEQGIINDIRDLTSVTQYEHSERLTLAAILATTLAAHLDDVWVWEVTLRMGKVLRKLADAYDENWLDLNMA